MPLALLSLYRYSPLVFRHVSIHGTQVPYSYSYVMSLKLVLIFPSVAYSPPFAHCIPVLEYCVWMQYVKRVGGISREEFYKDSSANAL
jgi:hypothetical protein